MISPYAKAALFVIRLSACGLMILSFAFYYGDIFSYLSPHPLFPISRPSVLALKAIPALAGVALLVMSKRIAIYLTKNLD